MESKNQENLEQKLTVSKLSIKKYLDRIKTLVVKNKMLAFIALGLTVAVLGSTTIAFYSANSRQEKIAPVPKPTISKISASIPTPTKVSSPTLIPPTATLTPTAGPTPTPTSEPIDPAKGAIRVKLLEYIDYQSARPLSNASGVKTTIKNGEFSSTKSGAEVYFYNLVVGQEYKVYIDDSIKDRIKVTKGGRLCPMGESCMMIAPAKIPIENLELEFWFQ